MQTFFKVIGRKPLFILALFVLSIAAAFAEDATKIVVPAAPSQTTANVVLPTLEAPTKGFLTPATPTLDLGTSAVVLIGTLPTGTKILRLYSYNGITAYGDSSLKTTTAALFPTIASGALSDPIPVSTTTPAIYVTGAVASCNLRLQCK